MLRKWNRYLGAARRVWIVLCIILCLSIACRDDDSPEVPEENGAEVENSEIEDPKVDWSEVDCEVVSLSRPSAQPGHEVLIEGFPEEFDGLFAEIRTEGGPDGASIAPVRRRQDDDERVTFHLYTPLHPIEHIQGGAVTVRLTDGEGGCPAMALLIEPLPSGPTVDGEFERSLNALEAFLEQQALIVGVDLEALAALQADDVPPHLLHLYIARHLFNHPGNPNSLRAIASTGEVHIDGETHTVDRALLDSIYAHLGVTAMLAEGIEDPRELRSMSFQPRQAALNAGQVPINNAEVLDNFMFIQANHERMLNGEHMAGKTLDAAQTFSGVTAILVPPVGIPASIFFWLTEKQMQASVALFPSYFLDMNYEYTAEFNEDFMDVGAWRNLTVDVRSSTYSLTKPAVEALFHGISLHGGLKTPDILNVGDLFGNFWESIVHEIGLNFIPEHGFEIGPYFWRDIDISEWPWSVVAFEESAGRPPVGFIRTGTEISRTIYAPVDVGQAVLTFKTGEGRFGSGLGNSGGRARRTMSKQESIVVHPIQVLVRPKRVAVATPGETVRIEVEVHNSDRPAILEWEIIDGAAQLEQTHYIGDGHHVAYFTTSLDTDDYTTIGVAESTSPFGLREKPDAPRRLDTFQLRHSEINLFIIPDDLCLEPGETHGFEARVIYTENQSVEWEASAGSIDTNGLYQAPQSKGQAIVSARSTADPEAVAEATVRIGDCSHLIVEGWVESSTGGPTFLADSDIDELESPMSNDPDGDHWWRGTYEVLATWMNKTYLYEFPNEPSFSLSAENNAIGHYRGRSDGTALFEGSTVSRAECHESTICAVAASDMSWATEHTFFVEQKSTYRIQLSLQCLLDDEADEIGAGIFLRKVSADGTDFSMTPINLQLGCTTLEPLVFDEVIEVIPTRRGTADNIAVITGVDASHLIGGAGGLVQVFGNLHVWGSVQVTLLEEDMRWDECEARCRSIQTSCTEVCDIVYQDDHRGVACNEQCESPLPSCIQGCEDAFGY
ncbi:MAG: hypothetical protein ACNA8W_15675 [Bradymonadaceae bacterium]